MGIETLAKKWAAKHLKLVSIDENSAHAEIALDRRNFELLKQLYVSEGGVFDNSSAFVVHITCG